MPRKPSDKPWPHTPSGYWCATVNGQRAYLDRDYKAACRKLKTLRTDRGGEFTFVEFGRYCVERGVERQLTAPYSPQQNGVVEWRNQSIIDMARCLLKTKALPGYFWGEAVATAVHILNRARRQDAI